MRISVEVTSELRFVLIVFENHPLTGYRHLTGNDAGAVDAGYEVFCGASQFIGVYNGVRKHPFSAVRPECDDRVDYSNLGMGPGRTRTCWQDSAHVVDMACDHLFRANL